MEFAKKYWISLIFIPSMILGFFFVHMVTEEIKEAESEQSSLRLQTVHEEAIAKITHSIENFATLVSGIRSFVDAQDSLPNIERMAGYVNNLLEDLEYKDSIIVSYLDTNHTFIYTFTRTEFDPANLAGTNVAALRDSLEIAHLNRIMQDHDLHLFEPLNLIEGWQGIPLNFGVQKKGVPQGYVASIINFKYIIQPIYDNPEVRKDFVFRFHIPNGPEFDREKVYDQETVYNEKVDEEFYQNFVTDTNVFTYTTIHKYGLNLRVGTALKNRNSVENLSVITIYLWYISFCALMLIIFYQLRKTKRFNLQLSEANQKIQSKNHSIQESLNFGKTTQAALLTSKAYMNQVLPEYFVLYKPKGAVGGDFYWVYKKGHYLFFAVVDCTGHGVSGALMSIVGNRLLNEIVKEKEVIEPASVLDQLRSAIIQGFDSADDHSISSYGMDMSFCAYDSSSKTLSFAGANSSILLCTPGPLEILTGGDQIIQLQNHLYKFKGNRQAIGKDLRTEAPFTQVKIYLESEFKLYLFTDGFMDQFGAISLKRFGHAKFIELLDKIQKNDFDQQETILEQELQKWKCEVEQIDDICILGIFFRG